MGNDGNTISQHVLVMLWGLSAPTDPDPDKVLEIVLSVGNKLKLQATENIDSADFTWTSTNDTVASVSGGLVSALSVGTATINVTSVDGTWSDSVNVRVIPPEIIPTKINNDDNRVTFNGSWVYHGSDSRFYNDDQHFSNQAGDFVEFTFTGTSIRYIGATSDNLGMCDIYINDVFIERVNLYSASLETQKLLFSATELTQGTHTIKIIVTGDKDVNATNFHVTVDAFEFN